MTGSDVAQGSLLDDGADTELITGEAVALDVRPASFILRTAGAVIDFLAYVLFLALLAWLLLAAAPGLDEAMIQALVTVLLVFCLVVVPTVVETVTQGKSLGKLVIGARIVRDDGGAIGLRHAFIRALTGVFEVFMTFGGLAALTALLNGKSKRLGDLLAGTYSQHERVPRVVSPVYGVPGQLAGWAATADVARMPDRLARRITVFLKQAPALTPSTRAQLAAELANEASVYVSPLPEVSPELFLAGVSSLRRDRDYRALMLERDRLARLDVALTSVPHDFPSRRA